MFRSNFPLFFNNSSFPQNASTIFRRFVAAPQQQQQQQQQFAFSAVDNIEVAVAVVGNKPAVEEEVVVGNCRPFLMFLGILYVEHFIIIIFGQARDIFFINRFFDRNKFFKLPTR